ncbi:MAG TPA: hypothetical protein VJZ94_01250, partial [Candidatus Paceibacterota bacterium]|nr:hypothetical protein [Candidatus Paceibacterota bacterium]
ADQAYARVLAPAKLPDRGGKPITPTAFGFAVLHTTKRPQSDMRFCTEEYVAAAVGGGMR